MINDIRNIIDKIKQLNETYTKTPDPILMERLGVPDNAVKTSIKIYDDIVQHLWQYDYRILSEEEIEEFYIRNEYTFGDYTFDSIKIKLELFQTSQTDTIDFSRFGLVTPSETKKNTKNRYKLYSHDSNPVIIISLVSPDTSLYFGQIKEFMERDKKGNVSRLAHEMAHRYEKFNLTKRNKGKNIYAHANYDAIAGDVSSGIKPMDRMIYYMYYIHDIEKITRPTELLASLEVDNVTKANFEQAVKDTEMYTDLVKMKNFTIDGMIQEIKNNPKYLEKLNNMYDDDPDYIALSTDEKIDAMLFNLYARLADDSIASTVRMLRPSFHEFMAGKIDNEKMDQMQNHVNYYQKGLKNVKNFYIRKQKELNRKADEMIKKIFKLYDQVPDADNQTQTTSNSMNSLKEWELDKIARKVKPPKNVYKK